MTIKLPSGREFDPESDFVGLADDLRVGDGFDSREHAAEINGDDDDPHRQETWSKEDKIALADVMIERWLRYRQSALAGQALAKGDEMDAAAVAIAELKKINAKESGDPEHDHGAADGILAEFIEALGFQEIADEYNKIDAIWYA